MTSGNPKVRALLAVLTMLLALCATAATLDADALIGRLAKPAPATIAFREVRFSPLVDEPLIVAGELGYAGPTSLDRRVTQPYRETVSIRGESVRVEREGEPTRSFGLNRAPELRGLLGWLHCPAGRRSGRDQAQLHRCCNWYRRRLDAGADALGCTGAPTLATDRGERPRRPAAMFHDGHRQRRCQRAAAWCGSGSRAAQADNSRRSQATVQR